MKKIFFLFSLFLVSVGCGKIKSKENKCIYFFDELVFKDTSKVIMEKSHTPNFQDVLERDDSSKEASLYQFDANKQLRFYAFLYNDSDYSFSITYDSLGNVIRKTGGDIVKWEAAKYGTDSLDVAFLLYSIGFSYGKINMTIGGDTFKNITLFKARKFSSLVGGSIRVLLRNIIGNKINVSGIKRNDCTHVYTNFKDSGLLELPSYKGISSKDYRSVSALSQNYNLHDTILLNVVISRKGEYYHGIGLEYKYDKKDNKWAELEPTINQIGKVEVFAKTIGPLNEIVKVVLPWYFNQSPESDFPIIIRFRLLEGVKIDKLDTVYSAPVLITRGKSK